ncbi:neocarzinostatin apoprotein domain-containing protein [Streptomyces sp. NPDC001889]
MRAPRLRLRPRLPGAPPRPPAPLGPPVLLCLCALLLLVACAGPAPAAESPPSVRLSAERAAEGEEITVSGGGWRPRALLTLLICGQNMIGGTNSCANAQGRTVTTDSAGGFSGKLPVAVPPRPCPCVVHAAAVTADRAAADAPLTVTGHPTAPLPRPPDGKLAVLTAARLEGDSGVLVLFGAPPARRLVLTVGNLGTTPVRDPVFRIGTAHGVYAPRWEERRWRGTIQPGRRALVALPVELSAGAHGDYAVSVRYGGRTLVSRPWEVPRPWGVTAFWVLLAVVVPAALFRIGMAAVDRVRPRTPARPAPGAPGAAPPRSASGRPGC